MQGESNSNMPVEQAEAYSLGWRGVGLILLFGVSLLVAYHLSCRTLTMHEVIFAQPAKEMLASGDYLVPRVGGVVFSDKPLLTMWLIAGCIQLFGSESEWVVRLPSSFAMLLTALMIGMTAARWMGRRTGILAGLIQLTCYYMLQMGTLAEADMLLICAVTACYCWFACVNIDSPVGKLSGTYTPWVFHVLLGLAFMIKGPLGIILVGLGLGSYMVISRQWSLLWFFFHPGGMLLIAVMALPYPVLAGLRHPPIFDEWMYHNWGRFSGEMSHLQSQQPMLFYVYHLPLMLLPAAPWLIFGCWGKAIWRSPITWWAWCWCIPGLLFLSCSAWKWKHYMSPLLPGLTLLMAAGLERWLFAMADVLHRIWRPLMCAVGLIAGVCITVVLIFQPLGMMPLLVLIPMLTLAALFVLEVSYRRWQRLLLPSLALLTWAMIVSTFCIVMPKYDQFRELAEFANRINQRPELIDPLYLVNLSYEQIIYYLKKPVISLDHCEKFSGDQHTTSPLFLLMRASELGNLHGSWSIQTLDSSDHSGRHPSIKDPLVLLKIEPLRQTVQAN